MTRKPDNENRMAIMVAAAVLMVVGLGIGQCYRRQQELTASPRETPGDRTMTDTDTTVKTRLECIQWWRPMMSQTPAVISIRPDDDLLAGIDSAREADGRPSRANTVEALAREALRARGIMPMVVGLGIGQCYRRQQELTASPPETSGDRTMTDADTTGKTRLECIQWDHPACPYCGAIHPDWMRIWPRDGHELRATHQLTCGDCDRQYTAEQALRRVFYSVSAEPPVADGEPVAGPIPGPEAAR